MKIILSLLAGIGIGFAASGMTAEEKPAGAYFIAEADVKDPVEDAKVIAKLPATAARYGGRYLARGGKIVGFSENPPKRIVIVAFDSMDAAIAWRADPQVKALEEERGRTGTTLLHYAVEGLQGTPK